MVIVMKALSQTTYSFANSRGVSLGTEEYVGLLKIDMYQHDDDDNLMWRVSYNRNEKGQFLYHSFVAPNKKFHDLLMKLYSTLPEYVNTEKKFREIINYIAWYANNEKDAN